MSEHERMQTLLGARHDLSPAERQALDAHVDACTSCRDLAQEYGRQDTFLRALPLPAPSPAIRQRVFSRIEQTPPRWQGLLRRALYLGAPALITVLAIVLITIRVAPPDTTSRLRLPVTYGPANGAPTAGVDQAASRAPRNPPGSVKAAPLIPPVPRRIDTFAGGVRLSLIVPPGAYQRNTLVPVTLEVQNRTSGLVWVDTWASFGGCDTPRPVVEAINARGQAVDPLPGHPIMECGIPIPWPHAPGFLRPGQHLRASAYVILLTNRLRARATITRYRGCDPRTRPSCQGRESHVLGRPLTFALRPGRAPRITLHGLPPSSFRVTPMAGPTTPLWYAGWFACGPPIRGAWTLSEGSIVGPIRPGDTRSLSSLHECTAHSFVLHLIAGYPNQPVAFITERRGHVRP